MTLVHHALLLGFLLVLGAAVGSFLNVCIYRIPQKLSVFWPPSRCPECGTRIALRDNVPILGWIALRGRCRSCSAAISMRYVFVEALVGFLFCGLYALTIGASRVDPSERGLIRFLIGLVPGMLIVSLVVIGVFITVDTRRFPARIASWGFLVTGVLVLALRFA